MNKLSSLEVFRPVQLPEGCSIVEEIAATGNAYFGIRGNSHVGIGQRNEVKETFQPRALYPPEDRLAFSHLSIAGENVKKFGKKIVDAVERLEGGYEDAEEDDYREGLPCTEGAFEQVMLDHDYPVAIKDQIKIRLDTVVEVSDARYPNKALFVLQPSEKNNGVTQRMLHCMSDVAYEIAAGNSDVIRAIPQGGLVNGVLVAEVDETVDEKSRNSFLDEVKRKLLPVEAVTLGKISASTENNF